MEFACGKFLTDFFIFGSLITLLTSCNNERKNHLYTEVPDSSIALGRGLAVKYCQSCHALPEPGMADVESWFNSILPEMGPRLGIFRYRFKNYPSNRFENNLPPDFYPAKPLVTENEWQHIIDYYCSMSPDSLPAQNRQQIIKKEMDFFKVLSPSAHFGIPATSLVKIGRFPNGSSIMTADALTYKLKLYNGRLQEMDSFQMPGPVVDQIPIDDTAWLMDDIGLLNPNDSRLGILYTLELKDSDSPGRNRLIFDSLRRPVKVLESDLNGDGRKDYIVCEFGNMIGALSWLENTGTGFIRHVLKAFPGAISAVINDYDHDGRPDIWCLFAQGDESIVLLKNLGAGKFEEKTLLQFPPIYGSSYFELDDFNKDGFPDILYTCGDNADYSPVLKPYHGIYIYMNNGRNQFTQKYFFPLNGCYKAMARDFDGDGDLDIAAISFFPDFIRQPEESFVYLENKGNLSFIPYSFPQADQGRWMTMDVGDIDGDGKPDILLGNFSIAPSFIHEHVDWKTKPPFVVLKNLHR
jgi:hypothetical protein